MNINDKLITNFRDTVNNNSGFVYEIYHSHNGENLWNIVCSCMDWISVAVRFLSNEQKLHDDVDVRVMQFYSYISAIDIVYEAIVQLHRTIFKNNEIPFKGSRTIFKNNKLNLDDNDYFKEIRAMFGAHPVNLKHKDKQRWYASWPYDHLALDNSTFEIRLYSNKTGVDDLTFGVHIDDLESFLIERYNYINKLNDEIIRQYHSFCEDLAKQNIAAKGEPLTVLKILESESKKRLNNDYYRSTIYELIKIFSTSIKEEYLIEEEFAYKIKLQLLIDEIKENLQAMKFDNLNHDKILNPDYPYSKIGYSISKLYTYDFDCHKEPLFDYHMKTLDEYSNYKYDFTHTKESDIVFLKLKMMLYRLSAK